MSSGAGTNQWTWSSDGRPVVDLWARPCRVLANAVDLCLRDRLLLACANLNSYGIAARGPLSGDPVELARRLESELADRYPHGTRSYAFWTEDADAALDD